MESLKEQHAFPEQLFVNVPKEVAVVLYDTEPEYTGYASFTENQTGDIVAVYKLVTVLTAHRKVLVTLEDKFRSPVHSIEQELL